MSEIITAETHPNHPIVGHTFRGINSQLYYCQSYDPSLGYWMVSAARTTNISERAINRTYHHAWTACNHKACEMGYNPPDSLTSKL